MTKVVSGAPVPAIILFQSGWLIICSFYLQIIWKNRYKDQVTVVDGRTYTRKKCKITVDGSDCRVEEPKRCEFIILKLKKEGKDPHPYDPRFKSHKFGKAALRYEVGVCIRTGDIVWINGPFPAGEWTDLKIYKAGLKGMLDDGEWVETDNGYPGEITCRMKKQFVSEVDRKAKSTALSRHENINSLLKGFNCLKQMFCHELKLHGACFAACAAITQMAFDAGEKPWQCRY